MDSVLRRKRILQEQKENNERIRKLLQELLEIYEKSVKKA